MKNLLIKSILLLALVTLAQTAFSKESVLDRIDGDEIGLVELEKLQNDGRMPASSEFDEFDGKSIDEIFEE